MDWLVQTNRGTDLLHIGFNLKFDWLTLIPNTIIKAITHKHLNNYNKNHEIKKNGIKSISLIPKPFIIRRGDDFRHLIST